MTVIAGDGIGPEITAATRQAVEALGVPIDWEIAEAGARAIATHGTPLPESTLASIRKNGLCLKGPLAPPLDPRDKAVSVAVRQELDLYASVRPTKSFAGLRSPSDNVDLIVIGGNADGDDAGTDLPVAITVRTAWERLIRFAFERAQAAQRNAVTLVHQKDNHAVMSRLFLEAGRQVAQGYPTITFNEVFVDKCALQLVRAPEIFDVMVTTRVFGDILGGVAAGLVGGLGVVAGGHFGKTVALFETVHGTAPDIAEKGIANPTALMMAAAMLLEHVGLKIAAQRLEGAVRKVIGEGVSLTPDLGGNASTMTFTERVISAIHAPLPA